MYINFKNSLFLLAALALYFMSNSSAIAQEMTYSTTSCGKGKTNGTIILSGGSLTANSTYNVVFVRKGYLKDSCQIKTDANATLKILSLPAGIYSQFTVISGKTITGLSGYVELNDSEHSYRTATYYNPTCGGNNGEIVIEGLKNNMDYHVTYWLDSTSNSEDLPADKNGTLTISGLPEGTYTEMRAYVINGTEFNNIYPVILINNNSNCIATQRTDFMGAAYQNFTGIQDDGPSGFTQGYARLTQPLNKGMGIPKEAHGRQRFIPLRNLLFQLTYGNTDNFKMYTTNIFDKKYVNRMDLLGHAYFDGTLNLNLLAYVIPKYWSTQRGDMGHLYLDFMTSLIATSVNDSGFSGYQMKPVKTFNIKSSLVGLSAKARFNNVFNSNFVISVHGEIFWLFPQTAPLNASLNPQNSDLLVYNDSIYRYNNKLDSQTLNSFLNHSTNVAPFLSLGVQVQYNTSPNLDNASNIFIKYKYTGNMARSTSGSFPNSFWQFQLGYNLDISKIFKQNPADKASSSDGKSDATASLPAKSTQIESIAKTDTIELKIVDSVSVESDSLHIFSQPSTSSKKIETIFKKKTSRIPINAYTNKGEAVSDTNPSKKWYRRSSDGNWFWSGNVK